MKRRGTAAGGRSRPRPLEGLTLVETALIVCIAGVVLSAFVPTFVRSIRASKIAEAPELLTEMHRRTAAYYASSFEDSAAGSPRRSRLRRCLPGPAGPTPKRARVEPRTADFSRADPTWQALRFSPARPIRFRYYFRPAQDGCGLRPRAGQPAVSFAAEGDLDGDRVFSLFERLAAVNKSGELVPSGILHVRDRTE